MASSISAAAVAGVICPRCGARPRNRCVTTRGAHPGTRKSYPCSERTTALYDVWRVAFREGMEQQAHTTRHRVEDPASALRGRLTEAEVNALCAVDWS